MTRLYLVRHGHPGDADKLSSLGEEMASHAAEVIAEAGKGTGFFKILTSPAIRARETAASIARRCNAEPEIVRWLDLGESWRLEERWEEHLASFQSFDEVVLVSHSPIIRELLQLLGTRRNSFLIGMGCVLRVDLKTRRLEELVAGFG